MCGIAGVVGPGPKKEDMLRTMIACQRHRGPDAEGLYLDPTRIAGLGHTRLSIIDLSAAGNQPMSSPDGRFWIAFNGEIYNYVELRKELGDYPFRTQTDTEVILAAYDRWGDRCLDRFIGMFAFLLWDARESRLFAARDRFGVKPLYYSCLENGLALASETRALRAAIGLDEPDDIAWATYLARGISDSSERTFWKSVHQVPPGHWLSWRDGQLRIGCWYDLAERVGGALELRPVDEVKDEYLALLNESVLLRFRSDVTVGINLSGGLDSSTLLGLVQMVQGKESDVKAFTFASGDPKYDELPWVRRMLAHTRHPSVVCNLQPDEIPSLAERTQFYQDAPFGGIPTICYGRLFERAKAEGVVVLLDGQGMDEQWAGYDYYGKAATADMVPVVQGVQDPSVRPDCLVPEFLSLAEDLEAPRAFWDPVQKLQYRDARYTKMPRALRFNDRVSMQYSTELREPFLDHRLFELALRQPPERKVMGDTHKVLLRQLVRDRLPVEVVEAPKRPVQTPQREWLRGPVREWANEQIHQALHFVGGTWLQSDGVERAWSRYLNGEGDNSFYVWQWVNLGLMISNTGWKRVAGQPNWITKPSST